MVALIQASDPATISRDCSLKLPVQKVKRLGGLSDRGHGCDGNKAVALVEAVRAKTVIYFLQ